MTHNKSKIRQSFSAAAASYDAMARLQKQVAVDLLHQSEMPTSHQTVLDLGCGTGFLTEKLADHVAVENLFALDIALSMLHQSRQRPALTRCHHICADAEALPFVDNQFNWIYSSLALQWCSDLSAVFKGVQQCLKASGKLAFATFGPATLKELKTAWKHVDDAVHVNYFYPSDHIEMALQRTGFTSIHLNSRLYTLSYRDVWALMRELKGIGAQHVNGRQSQRLITRKHINQMIAAYPKQFNGDIIASYEIFFVQAQL